MAGRLIAFDVRRGRIFIGRVEELTKVLNFAPAIGVDGKSQAALPFRSHADRQDKRFDRATRG